MIPKPGCGMRGSELMCWFWYEHMDVGILPSLMIIQDARLS